MKVIIKGKLAAAFKQPDYKDKNTGEISKGKHKLQVMVQSDLSNGEIRMDLQDISIPDSMFPDYDKKVGQNVSLECDFISKSPVNFYVKEEPVIESESER